MFQDNWNRKLNVTLLCTVAERHKSMWNLVIFSLSFLTAYSSKIALKGRNLIAYLNDISFLFIWFRIYFIEIYGMHVG